MRNLPVGSWPWAISTGGRVSARDRRSLLRQGFTLQVQRLLHRATRVLGGARIPIDVEHLRLPDSASALRAAEVCEHLSPPWLQHHCTRTYLWSSLVARHKRLKYDEELLFVAAMLHDLGLTEAHLGKDAASACFAVEGGKAAKAFAEQEHWDKRRQEALAEAICLHLNVRVGLEFGAEAHLLQLGAACDVMGTSLGTIAPKTRALVVECYPRLDFKREIDAAMQRQISTRPSSRIAFYYQKLSFGERIARAPFGE